ncbi:MAG: flagellar motor protein MotB [Phycisphaerales bacterium JB039]
MAKKRKAPAGVPEWVVTYGDMMSLLLCFFILLAAFSELKQERDYQDVVKSIHQAFGYVGGVGKVDTNAPPNSPHLSPKDSFGQDTIEPYKPAETVEDNIEGEQRTTSTLFEGAKFAVGGSLPFEPASDELTDAVERTLKTSVAPKLRGSAYKIEIRGHAWGAEDQTSGYDLADLSYRRAKRVMDYLVDECGVDRRLLIPMAIADAEPMVASRRPGPGQAQNRRVQIYQTEVALEERHPDPHWTGRP